MTGGGAAVIDMPKLCDFDNPVCRIDEIRGTMSNRENLLRRYGGSVLSTWWTAWNCARPAIRCRRESASTAKQSCTANYAAMPVRSPSRKQTVGGRRCRKQPVLSET